MTQKKPVIELWSYSWSIGMDEGSVGRGSAGSSTSNSDSKPVNESIGARAKKTIVRRDLTNAVDGELGCVVLHAVVHQVYFIT